MYAPVKDTTLALTANGWNAFSFQTLDLLDSGSATYHTTTEGVKIHGQGYRNGARLQTKTALPFSGKSLYFKWKGNGGGQFAAFVVQVKYNPLTNDGTPSIQGEDLTLFTTQNSFNGSTLMQEDVWYYTRITPVPNTDDYMIVTATNNYNTQGGTVVKTSVHPIYTKSAYLAFRMGDSYSTNAYGILGEVKIAD
ncbi:MAG: hypothetical protein ACO1NW_08815 [Chitinophagaceae bacterium]